MHPTVNIFMPTYEPRIAHLQAAIDSVLAQTETNWSLLIHDDASKADVRDIVERYLADPRITFRRSEKRLGIGGNWNACLVHGSAPFVQFLFQDDLWDPKYLRASVQAIDTTRSDWSFANHQYFIEGDDRFRGAVEERYGALTRLRESIAPGRHDPKEFLQMWLQRGLRPNIVGEPSFVMFKRSLFEHTGPFDVRLRQILDTEFWIRCLLAKMAPCFVAESLGSFRLHATAATSGNFTRKTRMKERLTFALRHPIVSLRAWIKK